MQQQEQSAPRNLLGTDLPEGVAQISLSLFVAAIQAVVVDLRGVHEMLEEPKHATAMADGSIPESLTFFIRTSIESVLVDHLEPAIKVLSKAASATLEDLDRG